LHDSHEGGCSSLTIEIGYGLIQIVIDGNNVADIDLADIITGQTLADACSAANSVATRSPRRQLLADSVELIRSEADID